jgi:hypothetical protein
MRFEFGQPTQSNELSPAAGQRANTTTLPVIFGVGQIGEVIPAATATRWPAPLS